MKILYRPVFLLIILAFVQEGFCQQQSIPDSSSKFRTIAAGPQYKRSHWHQFLWGTNYRKEWSKPVKLPVFLLNNTKGGLVPVAQGGGHQTVSLHLEDKNGQNYTLRSVDKRLGKVLPESFRGTFIEHIANDEVSMSHPYAAVTVPDLAHSAGIYHTTPEYVYVPRQEALDSFNDRIGNAVYLFEQRLKGDWNNSDNLGNFQKFYDTYEMMKKMQEETDYRVDQDAYVKARLFDMLLADWDRHEDQWRWGIVKKDGEKIFVPVPQDRDQVYFKHNGIFLNSALYVSGMKYFQSFKDHISNVKTLNYEERGLDRVLTNQVSKEAWVKIAGELRESLTDNIIESAVKKLPPEIFAISGKKIIADLKSRRNHLPQYAEKYYLFLSKEVEITGSEGSDFFEITGLNDKETVIKLYNINKKGKREGKPFYSRTFLNNETKEIRLFGLSGKDVYTVDGNLTTATKIKIIGGYEHDSILVNPTGRAKIYVYDNPDDYIQAATKIKRHISSDTAINAYVYRDFLYDVRGTKAKLLYSMDDRIYVGFGYGWQHQHWRKLPYVFKQDISAHYSITQKAASFTYSGIFPDLIGKWDLSLLANYDFIRWTNFYGLGNETPFTTKDKTYNRMRSRGAVFDIGFKKIAGENNLFELDGFFRVVKIINDENRFIAKNVEPVDPTVFEKKNYVGVAAAYSFSKFDDPIVPAAGVGFSANVSYTQNLEQGDINFWKYGGNFQLYIPLVSKFSLAISGGGETVDGKPQFYQYPYIGGGQDLRGFQLQRFYGKTAFYNSNELRFISKIKTYLLNGKAGLLGFVDDGRVWMPGENSDKWHVGYGGGVLIAPFNLVFLDITYGVSNEQTLLQLRTTMKF